LSGGLTLWRTWLTKRIAWRVTTELRERLHQATFVLSTDQQATTGERISAATHDVDELQYGVSAVVTAVRNPLTLLVLGATAFYMAPMLAPWVLLLLPALYFPARLGGRLLRNRGVQMRTARAALMRVMQEQLVGRRTIVAFGAERAEMARFHKVATADKEAKVRMEVERVIPPTLVQAISSIGIGFLLWFGGEQVVLGHLEASQLAGFSGAIVLMSRPLAGLSEVWSLLQRSLAALERVYETLDALPAVVSPEQPTPLPEGGLAIRWENVSLSFGEGPVLDSFSLDVAVGEWVAIVGATGAGKSSALKLLCRERDVDAGAVFLGGVDVRDLALTKLRSAIALVPQSGFIFARSIADNIRMGAPDASDTEVEAAAESAGIASFIQGLPDGYDTLLNELGTRLSGGQAQRISMARALLTDARVLILDEATNQVDAPTESAIIDALTLQRGKRTIVMVAHNFSAVRNADRIVVLEAGKVVESGTHAELVSRRGSYATMWAAQEGTPCP
jgi:subfamily B ATP-binding cassette protein MsbA